MANLSDYWVWSSDAAETEFRQSGKPTLAQLVEFLRSDKPIPREGRLWLADLLDASATNTPMGLRIVKRKAGRIPGLHFGRDDWIYQRIGELANGSGYPANIAPMKLEAAIETVADELMQWEDKRTSRSSLMEIWSRMRGMYEEAGQAARDEE